MAKKLDVYVVSLLEYEQRQTRADEHGEDVSVLQYVKAPIMNVLQNKSRPDFWS